MFYTFRQNNSYGEFKHDIERGLTVFVIVEATDKDAANNRAEACGIYFDGVEKGLDCECCGDRWSRLFLDVSDFPEVYGLPANEMAVLMGAEDFPPIAIHYLNGYVELFEAQ